MQKIELGCEPKASDSQNENPEVHVPAKLARRLSEGVGAWLHFEYLCRRSGLFCESYLSVPIGHILTAVFGERIHSEFEHPILAPLMKGPGRRPSLDFVYCDPYPKIRVAVEAKWAGSVHATPENIIWDLIRLELIAYHFNAVCIFLLAGQKSDLTRLFANKDFAGAPHTPHRCPILRVKSGALSKLSLLPDKYHRISLLKATLSRCQDVAVPTVIHTQRSKPFPIDCKDQNYQVFAWEVRPAPNRSDFIPKDNPHFRLSQVGIH